MTSPLLDIIIVNRNTGQALCNCLESIALCSQTGFSLDRICIIDNDSQDGSGDISPGSTLPLLVVKNHQNLGFATACNQGARESRAEYLLFLNPDTRLPPETLSRAIEFMEKAENQNIGICGGLAVDPRNQVAFSAARFPSLRIFLGTMTGLSHLFPRLFPPHQLSPAEVQMGGVVDQIIGAFFLVRQPLFERIKGFDERFFVYFEEVDFSWRARQKGYLSYLLPQCRYIHIGCVSSNQEKGRRLFYFLRSRILYAFKHFPPWEAWLLTFMTFTLEFLERMILSLALFSFQRLTETVEGFFFLIRHLLRKGIHP